MKRIIPVIQINNRKAVKTIKGKSTTYIGCPVNAVKILSDSNASEILINDISASVNNVIDFDFLEQIAYEAYVPLSYSGGVSSLDDFDKLFKMGFEKVVVEKIMFSSPNIVSQAVEKYGSSAIVGSITLKETFFKRKYFGPFNSKNKILFETYLSTFLNLGIGEILFNNIVGDGTFSGFNFLDYVEKMSESRLPIVVVGGISSNDEIIKLLKYNYISGVGLGSLSCYRGLTRGILINYPKNVAPHLNI